MPNGGYIPSPSAGAGAEAGAGAGAGVGAGAGAASDVKKPSKNGILSLNPIIIDGGKKVGNKDFRLFSTFSKKETYSCSEF